MRHPNNGPLTTFSNAAKARLENSSPALVLSAIFKYKLPTGVLSSLVSINRITSFCFTSKGSAIIICNPTPISIARYVRLINGRPTLGTAFDTFDRPTEIAGAGSQANCKVLTASINCGQYSWQPETVKTNGSMIRFSIG